MKIQDYANQSKLSLNTLKRLATEKIIQDPLTETDLISLQKIEKLWTTSWFLKRQLRKFSKDRRFHLVETCEFDTKWEEYAFTRFTRVDENKKITMKKVISEIEHYYDMTLNIYEKRKLYAVRESVYNRRRYKKKKSNMERREDV